MPDPARLHFQLAHTTLLHARQTNCLCPGACRWPFPSPLSSYSEPSILAALGRPGWKNNWMGFWRVSQYPRVQTLVEASWYALVEKPSHRLGQEQTFMVCSCSAGGVVDGRRQSFPTGRSQFPHLRDNICGHQDLSWVLICRGPSPRAVDVPQPSEARSTPWGFVKWVQRFQAREHGKVVVCNWPFDISTSHTHTLSSSFCRNNS